MIIFLSYRREDAGGWVRGLVDILGRKFGRKNVFIDVDNIRDFEDFEANIFANIDHCDLFLAVIGQRWLNVRDQQSGDRRLDRPDDYVRLEIARALQRKITVLPVLVDNSVLPQAEQLPEDLRDLLRPRVHALTPERWNEDIAELLRNIDPRPSLTSRRAILATMLIFAAGVLTGSLRSKMVDWAASLLSSNDISPGFRYGGSGYIYYIIYGYRGSSGYGYYTIHGYQGSIGGHLL
jgi:hypothetical protein